MAYNPSVKDLVLIDKARLPKKNKEKRFGAIINMIERRIDRNKYETIYVIRNSYGDVFHCRIGQFISARRRHIDGVIS